MADLQDGESVEMAGSGAKPYVLKNVGGVYSCSCPAWRNQSLAIEKRTCKHLRKLRGDAAEEARVGSDLPDRPKQAKEETFEYSEGKSNKFWEISVQGADMTVNFGRIGTNGQTKTKTFADAAAAQREADKLIEEKTGKGYQQIT